MAYGIIVYAECAGVDGVQHRVEVQKDGYSGSQYEAGLHIPGLVHKSGDEGDDLDTALVSSQILANFIAAGAGKANILSSLRGVQNAGARDYKLAYKKGGTLAWQGYVLPRFSSFALHDGSQVVPILAKDRLRSLRLSEFLDGSGAAHTGKQEFSVILANVLGKLEYSMGYEESSLWKPNTHTGDPLALKVNQERFREQQEDENGNLSAYVYRKNDEVLRSCLQGFGLRCVQHDDLWRLSYPGAHYGVSNVTVRDYDTGGSQTGSASESAVVDITPNNFVRGSDRAASLDPVGQSRLVYDIGPVSRSEVLNGKFGLWDAPDEARFWSYSGGDANFKQIIRATSNFGLGIFNAVTAFAADPENPSVAEEKAALSVWASQNLGQMPSGPTETRISWIHETYRFNPTTSFIVELNTYMRIKLSNATDTYYWVRSSGHDGAFQHSSTLGTDEDIHSTTNPSKYLVPQEDWIDITNFPITGDLEIELGQCARGDFSFLPVTEDDFYAVWDDIKVEYRSGDDTGEASVTFIVEDTSVEEGVVLENTLLIGDGPSTGALGAIYMPDASTLAGSWQRKAGATQMPHSQLVATEIMRQRKLPRRTIRLTSTAPNNNIVPHRAIDFDGVRYWPIVIEREQPSGRVIVYAVELRDDAATFTNSTVAEARQTGVFLGDGAAVFTDLNGRILDMRFRSKTTETTATIQAGSRTSATITGVDALFKSGDTVAIVDIVTGRVYYVTISSDYVAFSTTLNFNASTFPNDVKAGSYVFHDVEKALVRQVITDRIIRQTVEAGELCKVTETLSGVNRTSITVDGLNFDIKNNDRFKLIRSDGGDAIGLIAASDQSATAGTLSFDNGSGGSVNITCQSGDSIVYDGAFVGSSISQSATSIEAEVQARHEFEAIGLLNGGYSGSRSTLSIKAPGLKLALRTGTKLMVGDLMGQNWVEIDLSQDHSAGATTLNIVTKDIGTLSDGDVVKIPDYSASGLARILQDEINLRVLKTDFDARLVGKTLGLLSASLSGNNKTQMSVKSAKADGGTGADMELPTDTPLAITNPSNGDTAIVWANEEISQGESTINIYDGEGTNVDIISARTGLGITLPVDSVVSVYNGHPNISKTAINLFLESIEVDTNLIWLKTNAELKNDQGVNWDWRISENGFATIVNTAATINESRAYTLELSGDVKGALWGYFVNTNTKAIVLDGEPGDYPIHIQAPVVKLDSSGEAGIELNAIDGSGDINLKAGGDIFIDPGASGKVGFNELSPSYDFDFDGVVRVQGTTRLDGSVVSGALAIFQSKSSGSYSPSFDRRVKFTIDGIDVYLYGVDAP